jgi:glycerophosphoryl diester phosphodiesterase
MRRGGIRARRNCELLIIAHRGASGDFPENTLPAFAGAIAAGAAMCELDVHLSRDGVPIVIHDRRVDRTTDGRGSIGELTLAEIRALDAGVRFAPRFAGTRVPRLEEVIELCAGRCALNVEIKAAGAIGPTCAAMRAGGMLERGLISSFEWPVLEAARRLEPDLAIGLLADRAPAAMLSVALSLRATAIHPRYPLAGAALCARAHAHGLAVYAWTVDSPATAARLKSRGVDGIMTNYPARMAALAVAAER